MKNRNKKGQFIKGHESLNKKYGKEVKCRICGKIHYKSPSHLTRAKYYYCSRKCQDISRRTSKEKIICSNCGKIRHLRKREFKLLKVDFCVNCNRLMNIKKANKEKSEKSKILLDSSKIYSLFLLINS